MQEDEPSELSLSDTSHVFLVTVLKLLKMATGMRALLDTVVQALPQVKPTSFPQDSLHFFFPQRVDSLCVSKAMPFSGEYWWQVDSWTR